jgi:predicted anti-sigma-YlaC factor YlaD
MNCGEVQKRLNRLIAHQDISRLSPPTLEHLRECAVCRAKMQTVQETIRLMTHMPQVSPQPEFSLAWQRQVRLVAAEKREA